MVTNMSQPISRPAPFFIGDHPALDFLNTTATPPGSEPIEWLANGADLMQWLEQSGAVDSTVTALFRAMPAQSLDKVAHEARALREWFRKFVQGHAGRPLRPGAIDELLRVNRLLAQDDQYQQIVNPLRLRQERRWTSADRLLQPIAAAIADLVCHADFRYVRECEAPACTLLFYDRSKTHGRRWCSMAVCGNRAKAAAHRARVRERKSKPKRRSGSS